MAKKCKHCGYEYGEEDIFCSRCGNKINDDDNQNINLTIENFNIEKTAPKNQKVSFHSQNAKKIFDNSMVQVAIFFIVMLCALCFVMFFVLEKYNNHKEVLQFKNYIHNPSQIPLLKEPSSYKSLSQNLSQVERFLLLYFKNSSDSQEKKEQIFSAYLTELNKMPNILNEKYDNDSIFECAKNVGYRNCCKHLNKLFKNNSLKVFCNKGEIYLYPDYKFIKKHYESYLSNDYKRYILLKAKYNYPVALDLDLIIEPKQLANKIADFEKLYSTVQNEYLKDIIEKEMYYDFRKFIFTPSIYATTTREMKKEFKKAYVDFINKNKNSNFRPLIMSYLDKKIAYSEENFKNDYPYKSFDEDNFMDSFKNSVLEDIFVQLRKNIFTDKNTDLSLAYVYDLRNGKWSKYNPQIQLDSSQYVISEPDENNNVSIYNSAFSPLQELNILKYSKMYLISGGLYLYNNDKLSVSKVTFNGKTFNLYNLNHVDITSLFPGIEVINIDSFPSYNIIIEKDNAQANYIILSRYSQGWSDYSLSPIQGKIGNLALPNMFSVNSNSDVVISFGNSKNNSQEISEQSPAYTFTIRTRGHKETQNPQESYAQYDKQTQMNAQNETEKHTPNIMPKLKEMDEKVELEQELLTVPEQKIEPPTDDNDD